MHLTCNAITSPFQRSEHYSSDAVSAPIRKRPLMVQLPRQSGLLKRDESVFEQVGKEFGHRIGKVVVSLINGIA